MEAAQPARSVRGKYAAVDVDYPSTGGANAAVVVAEDPTFSAVVTEHTAWLDEVSEYRPGAFYERELPALRAVLAQVQPIDLLIVDGYVDLDPGGRPGLGARASAMFGVPVIGVAKTAFRSATHAQEVLRGQATRPLYVTAAGVDPKWAAQLVAGMAGRFRIPDALNRVDALARRRAFPPGRPV